MGNTSTSKFFSNLRASRLLEEEEIKKLEEAVSGDPRQDAWGLAAQLVALGRLTRWQAEELLRGRTAFFLGKYKLLEPINAGGMGQVLKATHTVMQRLVALKILGEHLFKDPNAQMRFEQEIRLASTLDHPNIVRAFDADRVGGRSFLVMEYIEGEDLQDLVTDRGPLAVQVACDYCRQAALGLEHARERGLVHRDIKPANLLLARASGDVSPLVKILDFGLARLTEGDSRDPNLTPTGCAMGTPDYIAPEQLRHASEVDIRADIYSLGCSLFWLLTRQFPFRGETATDRMLERVSREPLRLRAVREEAPRAVDRVVGKMLARAAEDRYQTPLEVARALVSCSSCDAPLEISAPVPAPPPEPLRSTEKMPRRGLPLTAALLACVSLLLAIYLWPKPELKSAPPPRERVSAFSPSEYWLGETELAAPEVKVPLETNCPVTALRLERPSGGAPMTLPLPHESGDLTTEVRIPSSYLRQGNSFALAVTLRSHDGDPVEKRKNLRIHRPRARLEKVDPPEGTTLDSSRSEVVLKAVQADSCRLRLDGASLEVDASGHFRVRLDPRTQKNCLYPVPGTQDHLLVRPLTLIDPCGRESTLFAPVYRCSNRGDRTVSPAPFQLRSIDGRPARGWSAELPLPVFAGSSVELEYNLFGLPSDVRLTARLVAARPPDGQALAPRTIPAGRVLGRASLELPPEPGAYLLELVSKSTRGETMQSVPLDVRDPAGELKVSVFNIFQEWRPGQTEVHATSPAAVVCRVPFGIPLFIVNKKERESFRDGGVFCLILDEKDVSTSPSVELVVKAGPAQESFRWSWESLDAVSCKACKNGYSGECSACNGKGTINRAAQCLLCKGKGENRCAQCGGKVLAAITAIDSGLAQKLDRLGRIEADFRDALQARGLAEASRDERGKALNLLEPSTPQSSLNADKEFRKVEEIFWMARDLFHDGRYLAASERFREAYRCFQDTTEEKIEVTEVPKVILDQSRARLEDELKESRKQELREFLTTLQNSLETTSCVTLGTDFQEAPARIGTISLTSKAFGKDGALTSAALDALLSVGRKLLRPEAPQESAADRLRLLDRQGTLGVLTRESLRVLEAARDPGALLAPASPPASRENSGGRTWSVLFSLLTLVLGGVAFVLWRASG